MYWSHKPREGVEALEAGLKSYRVVGVNRLHQKTGVIAAIVLGIENKFIEKNNLIEVLEVRFILNSSVSSLFDKFEKQEMGVDWLEFPSAE